MVHRSVPSAGGAGSCRRAGRRRQGRTVVARVGVPVRARRAVPEAGTKLNDDVVAGATGHTPAPLEHHSGTLVAADQQGDRRQVAGAGVVVGWHIPGATISTRTSPAQGRSGVIVSTPHGVLGSHRDGGSGLHGRAPYPPSQNRNSDRSVNNRSRP